MINGKIMSWDDESWKRLSIFLITARPEDRKIRQEMMSSVLCDFLLFLIPSSLSIAISVSLVMITSQTHACYLCADVVIDNQSQTGLVQFDRSAS